MQWQPDSLRQAYLDFFVEQGHAVIPSSPLVPENDPTTLFTGSGMQPMVPYLLGQPHPLGSRIVDSQRCFRSQDIEEIGDNRHTTYFEMLGNWSLGDYFKAEQLQWFFTFLTDVVGIDPARLYVSVFAGNVALGIARDDESVAIWQQLFAQKNLAAPAVADSETKGMQQGRIFYYGETKNWWSRAGVPGNMPAGEPGGPDSEVFYDFGAERQLHEKSAFKDQPCHINCDCGRFLEIGNNVFMQFQKQTDGTFAPLPKNNVDFGGGLERILAAANNEPDVFSSPFFQPLIAVLEEQSGRTYRQDELTTRAMRIIADHVRAAVMLGSDGVFPANKEQGYFSRRLLRRAMRYAHMIELPPTFLTALIQPVAQLYRQPYPSVAQQQAEIEAAFTKESERFAAALQKGLRYLEKNEQLDEQTAFYLYESYGFPFELTAELATEKGIQLDAATFDELRRQHANASRTASAGKFKGGLQDASEMTVKYHTATHLLHAALRQILGTHVQQQGSNITAERLRFDFSHPSALTPEQQVAVINQINDWIKADLPVHRQVMAKTAALDQGALAFFGQKYPDEVSVYTIGTDPDKGWISKELCGGPHVSRTGQIGPVQLIKEQAVAAGTRRVYLSLVA